MGLFIIKPIIFEEINKKTKYQEDTENLRSSCNYFGNNGRKYIYIISSRYKINIRKQLDENAINATTVYPEMEKKAKYIKCIYYENSK